MLPPRVEGTLLFAPFCCLFSPLLSAWGRMAEGGSECAHHQQTWGRWRSAQHQSQCLVWRFMGKSQNKTSMVRGKRTTTYFLFGFGFLWSVSMPKKLIHEGFQLLETQDAEECSDLSLYVRHRCH